MRVLERVTLPGELGKDNTMPRLRAERIRGQEQKNIKNKTELTLVTYVVDKPCQKGVAASGHTIIT